MAKRRRRPAPVEERALIESFVRFVRLMGPCRKISVNVRRAFLHHLTGTQPVAGLCGLMEWYMHRKKRAWATDLEAGLRWREHVERWIEENRGLVSAIILAG